MCCCCVAVRPWTGQRPLDKSDNILSLFHEWIASDVVSIEIWGKIEIPTSQCRKLRCQVPWLATVSKISLLRARYPSTNLTSSWVDFMNMVEEYICDFEIKQNVSRSFRAKPPCQDIHTHTHRCDKKEILSWIKNLRKLTNKEMNEMKKLNGWKRNQFVFLNFGGP